MKKLAVETWEYVNWLTHAKNAVRMDAEIGLKAVEHLLGVFTAARLRLGRASVWCEECWHPYERGLDSTRPLLVVIEVATALRRAVTDVFDHLVIQRCQLHKLRNVTDRVPDALPRWWPSGCGPPTATPTRLSARRS